MWRKLAPFVAAILIAGCAADPEMPLLGNWEGGFVPDQPTGTELKGYVQLYATGHRFKMHVGTDSQTFDPTGTWQIKGRQIFLDILEIQVSGLTADEAATRKKSYLQPADVRSAYGKTLVLNLAPDGKSLEGLPITVAGTSGRHEFRKLDLSHYQ